MASHLLQQTQNLKHSLERLVGNISSGSSSLRDEEEQIMDILKILQGKEYTKEALVSAQVANVIKSILNINKGPNYSSNLLSTGADVLKKVGIKIMPAPQLRAVKSPVGGQNDGSESPPPPPPPLSPMVAEDNKRTCANNVNQRKAQLNQTRKTIFTIFKDIFKKHPIQSQEIAALDIEESLFQKYLVIDESSSSSSSSTVDPLSENKRSKEDIEKEKKKKINDYVTKAKSLAFNLKKNTPLQDAVIHKDISAERLMNMTSNELASQEILSEREKVSSEQTASRRLDWLEQNKREILVQLALDPDNAWHYDNDSDTHSEPDLDPPDV